MPFPEKPRVIYARNPLDKVICHRQRMLLKVSVPYHHCGFLLMMTAR